MDSKQPDPRGTIADIEKGLAVLLEIARSAPTQDNRPRAVRVTQKTALPVYGLTPRAFLDLLPAFRAAGGEVLEIGKARSVAAEDFERWLRSRSAAPSTTAAASPASAYARELGLATGRRR